MTYGTPDTLSRNVVEATNGNAPVSWGGGDALSIGKDATARWLQRR